MASKATAASTAEKLGVHRALCQMISDISRLQNLRSWGTRHRYWCTNPVVVGKSCYIGTKSNRCWTASISFYLQASFGCLFFWCSLPLWWSWGEAGQFWATGRPQCSGPVVQSSSCSSPEAVSLKPGGQLWRQSHAVCAKITQKKRRTQDATHITMLCFSARFSFFLLKLGD